MRPIRRAAVTGLFALWLAPLPALAGSQSSNACTDCAVTRISGGADAGDRAPRREPPREAATAKGLPIRMENRTSRLPDGFSAHHAAEAR